MVRQFVISVIVIAFLAMSFVVVQNWKVGGSSVTSFKVSR